VWKLPSLTTDTVNVCNKKRRDRRDIEEKKERTRKGSRKISKKNVAGEKEKRRRKEDGCEVHHVDMIFSL
jgi:hypothetical protein